MRLSYKVKLAIMTAGLVVVLIMMAAILSITLKQNEMIMRSVYLSAEGYFESVVLTRRWNAHYGGVYVLKKEGMRSNPYLENPDITTADGVVYTKKNPALMTREISKLAKQFGTYLYHITSLNLINPNNTPDPWERESLQAFETGVKEVTQITELEGKKIYRFMRPLLYEKGCVSCHAKQGYRLGDVRGGISVSLPYNEIEIVIKKNQYRMLAMAGSIAIVMALIFYFVVWQLMKKLATTTDMLETEKNELRIAQLNLTKERGTLDDIVSSIDADLFLVDRKLKILWINKRMKERGLSDRIGRACTKIYDNLDIIPEDCPTALAFKHGKTMQRDRSSLQPDGTIHWHSFTCSPVKDNFNNIIQVLVLVQDITGQKLMDAKLRETHNYLENLLDYANAPIIVWDTTLRITRFNHAFERLTDFTADEVIGQELHILFPVASRDESLRKISHTLSGEYWESVEIPVLCQDGKTRLVLWNSANIYAEDGTTLLSTIAQGNDITDRKRLEESLNERVEELAKARRTMLNMMEDIEESRKEAETATQAKSNFLANMSHEIRTPLNSVLGFLELVLEDASLSELQRKHLTTAQISANGLLGLINDILDISKLESGKLTIEQRPFNLSRLMQEIHETMGIRAREKGLNLQLDIQPSLSGSFIGDPLRLRQIMINLVGNAIKFTEKGSVSMQIMPAEEEGQLHFTIEDTGIGIPADRLSQSFEPFTQADTSTTRRFGGTGLGTTISRELVELMGGRIWAESEEGKGSTFHLTINIIPTDQVPEEADLFVVPGRAVLPGSRRGFRILLAEDIEANMDLAKIRLEQQGHEVTVAWNGREAVEAFVPGEIDVILMDIQMPEMSGIEATKRIRALEAGTGGHVPIIAITAGVMREETEKYLEVGMDAVVAKPIDFSKLFRTMEGVVQEGVGEMVAEVQEDVHPPSELELPPLDGVDIKKGIQTWQNPEAYAKALLGFSRDYNNAATDLSRLIDEGDIDSAYRIVHTLKGVAGNLSITEVADATINIDGALREKRIDDVKDQLPTLAAALNRAVDSIRQLEAVEAVEEMPKKRMDIAHLKALFIEMLAAFDQFSPYTIEPFLSELKEYLSQDQLNPIVAHMERFDFDGAKQETVKLAKILKIDLRE